MSHKHRITLARISFVILVIIIPVSFGIGWNEHRRTDALERAAYERERLSYEACVRVNALRREHNKLLLTDREQARILIDYMRLDISVDMDASAERETLKKLLTLYEATLKQEPIKLISCKEIYPLTKEE